MGARAQKHAEMTTHTSHLNEGEVAKRVIVGKHTRFVQKLKLLFAVLIIGLVGALLIVPLFNRDSAGVRLEFSAGNADDNEKPMMKNPRFRGVDENNEPYMVTAEYAVQKSSSEVILHDVKGDMTMKDEAWLLVSAKEGLLKIVEKLLTLTGDVKLFHDKGYEFSTEKIDVNIAKGEAFSQTPVEGRGRIGYIKSQRFSVYERGQRFVFDGKVSMIIHPSKFRR